MPWDQPGWAPPPWVHLSATTLIWLSTEVIHGRRLGTASAPVGAMTYAQVDRDSGCLASGARSWVPVACVNASCGLLRWAYRRAKAFADESRSSGSFRRNMARRAPAAVGPAINPFGHCAVLRYRSTSDIGRCRHRKQGHGSGPHRCLLARRSPCLAWPVSTTRDTRS